MVSQKAQRKYAKHIQKLKDGYLKKYGVLFYTQKDIDDSSKREK